MLPDGKNNITGICLIMSKPFLILQLRPEDNTSDNEFAAILKYSELEAQAVHRIRIEKQGIPDDLLLSDYCAVIVGGSPFDLSTADKDKSAIQKKIEQDFKQLFDQIVKNDFPFLGACSGNALLGTYLGVSISKKYAEPVSCVNLKLTKEGKNDPLLSDFPSQIAVLLGHKEACDTTPEGAVLLMTGTNCPVQMFRISQNIYATQFHPEGDSEGFIMRIRTYKNHGYFPPQEADQLIEHIKHKKTPYAQKILKRFADRYS